MSTLGMEGKFGEHVVCHSMGLHARPYARLAGEGGG